MERIKKDCRHMRWDRPCIPHKREGVHCRRCPYYEPVGERTVVIKLDALGDVLRTTCILPPLKEKYKKAHVTWITMGEAVPLLQNNPYLDRVIPYGPDALAVLGVEKFDLLLCLDAAPRSATLAGTATAAKKLGFGADRLGHVVPFNRDAVQWFLMGLFDDLKKNNRRTYQDIVLEICGLESKGQEIIVRLTEGERDFARHFAGKRALPCGEKGGIPIIGVNAGSGKRWPMKQWPVSHCVEFIKMLIGDRKKRVLLFGGEEEEERNREIEKKVGGESISTGCHNSLREFLSLLDLCDLVVTGDTLGLHAALGLGKRVVGLFGPTSAAEVDMYGRGIKIIAPVNCACCYLRECGVNPSCMGSIKPASVLEAVEEALKEIGEGEVAAR